MLDQVTRRLLHDTIDKIIVCIWFSLTKLFFQFLIVPVIFVQKFRSEMDSSLLFCILYGRFLSHAQSLNFMFFHQFADGGIKEH